tara:strand:+ start:173 stop:1042 length:870 start_codon:yes stop_codon:yes gene_type:complete
MNYFYIFSKLSTSIVLILIIILMGYALYQSYQEVDIVAVNLEDRIDDVSNSLSNNNKDYIDIKNKLIETDQKLNNIASKIDSQQLLVNKNKYDKDIENLINLNTKLQDQINELSSRVQFSEKKLSLDKNSNSSNQQIKSLINLITIKYKNGERINNELILLSNLLPNKNEIYEKLFLIDQKNFYGINNLYEEFDTSVILYIKNSMIENNESIVLNFLYKFVSVKPSNLDKFNNEDLNILMQVKKLMKKDETLASLKKILEIEKNEKFFLNWINQSKLYLEFKTEIERII